MTGEFKTFPPPPDYEDEPDVLKDGDVILDPEPAASTTESNEDNGLINLDLLNWTSGEHAKNTKQMAEAEEDARAVLTLADKARLEAEGYKEEAAKMLAEAKGFFKSLRGLFDKIIKRKPKVEPMKDMEFLSLRDYTDIISRKALRELELEFHPSDEFSETLKNAKTLEEKIKLIRDELRSQRLNPLEDSDEGPIIDEDQLRARLIRASNIFLEDNWQRILGEEPKKIEDKVVVEDDERKVPDAGAIGLN